jgi:hypothetical protein
MKTKPNTVTTIRRSKAIRFIVGGCGFPDRAAAENFKEKMGFPNHVCNPPYSMWPEIEPLPGEAGYRK